MRAACKQFKLSYPDANKMYITMKPKCLTPAVTAFDAKTHRLRGERRIIYDCLTKSDRRTKTGHGRTIINAICSEFPDFKVYSSLDEFFVHNVMSGGTRAIDRISNFVLKIYLV